MLTSRPVRFNPEKEPRVSTVWTPELLWTVWSREKSLVLTGIRTPVYPARRLPHTARVGGKMFCEMVHLCVKWTVLLMVVAGQD